MIEQYEALGEVTAEGRFEVFDRDHMLKAIQHFKRGTVLFSMKFHRETRSSAQNRFWHGVVVPAFAEHCGYRFAEAKDALALELIPREVTDMKTGEIKVVPGHTSDLNTKEFNELIERAQQLGAEMGIYIPDPGEDVSGRKGRAS